MKSPSLLETRVREYTALLRERLRLEELEGASCADELAEVNRRISDMQQAAEFFPDSAQHDKLVSVTKSLDESEPGAVATGSTNPHKDNC